MTRHHHPNAPLSERVLHRLPAALVEYPLESLLAAWGLISGPPLLMGLATPRSINSLLPRWEVVVWAALLTLAAATIAKGLRTRCYGTTVARGLYLLASTCACYAVTILGVAGWRDGIPSGPLLTVIAALCLIRGSYLRWRDRESARINASRDETLRVLEQREAERGLGGA